MSGRKNDLDHSRDPALQTGVGREQMWAWPLSSSELLLEAAFSLKSKMKHLSHKIGGLTFKKAHPAILTNGTAALFVNKLGSN